MQVVSRNFSSFIPDLSKKSPDYFVRTGTRFIVVPGGVGGIGGRAPPGWCPLRSGARSPRGCTGPPPGPADRTAAAGQAAPESGPGRSLRPPPDPPRSKAAAVSHPDNLFPTQLRNSGTHAAGPLSHTHIIWRERGRYVRSERGSRNLLRRRAGHIAGLGSPRSGRCSHCSPSGCMPHPACPYSLQR